MKSITAVYEKGVFRPLGPVDLPEGAQVEVNVVQQKETRPAEASQQATERLVEPLVGEELATLLQSIDALPLEGETHPADLSTTYREILYRKHGKMPGSVATIR